MASKKKPHRLKQQQPHSWEEYRTRLYLCGTQPPGISADVQADARTRAAFAWAAEYCRNLGK